MSISQNRHNKEKWAKKKHPASKCGKPKCSICHPNKAIGGNNAAAIKKKYRILIKQHHETDTIKQ